MNPLAQKIAELMTVAQERRLSFLIVWDSHWKFELRGQNYKVTYQKSLDEGLDQMMEKVMKKSQSQAIAVWDADSLAELLNKVPADSNTGLRLTCDFRKGGQGRVFAVRLTRPDPKPHTSGWYKPKKSYTALSHDASAALAQVLSKAGLL